VATDTPLMTQFEWKTQFVTQASSSWQRSGCIWPVYFGGWPVFLHFF